MITLKIDVPILHLYGLKDTLEKLDSYSYNTNYLSEFSTLELQFNEYRKAIEFLIELDNVGFVR